MKSCAASEHLLPYKDSDTCLNVFFPHAAEPREALSICIRRDASVEEVIGHALWSYWDAGREPALTSLPPRPEDTPAEREQRKKWRMEATGWALRIAEDDWRHAVAGVEGPETWSTPAYRAMPIELAGIGITASLELWRATGGQQYADKAVELARVIVESQQKAFVGTEHPLAGFFWMGPAGRVSPPRGNRLSMLRRY